MCNESSFGQLFGIKNTIYILCNRGNMSDKQMTKLGQYNREGGRGGESEIIYRSSGKMGEPTYHSVDCWQIYGPHPSSIYFAMVFFNIAEFS